MTVLDDRDFRATLMSKDIPLANIHGRRIEPLQEHLLPLQLQRMGDIETWLSMRAIDEHRVNSRLLKKVLRLEEKDNVSTALKFNGATITDTYWVRPWNSNLRWDQVRFTSNYFDTLALRGDLSAFSQRPSRTPELTNTGSFEKCWRLENGEWWMYKAGNEYEQFSELFIEQLGCQLGFPMAHYELSGGYIKTRDFTSGATVNFEPAFGLVGDNEDYVHNYRVFQNISQDLADQYFEIILMDTVCLNADRHTNNYGVLRNPDTGKILRLAPNFDNNIALISRGYNSTPRKPDIFGDDLRTLQNETNAAGLYAARHPLPVVTASVIDRAYAATGMQADLNYLRQFVLTGYQQTPIVQMATALEQSPLIEP